MTLAFSYVRFSTKHQASGTSLERQVNASKLFCSQNGLTLSNQSYHDLGISGFKNVRRPELEQMLEAIQTGDIPSGSYILIEAIDRLSRKGISHTQDILKKILQYDVKVAFVGEDAKTLQGHILNKDSLNDLSSVILVALAADLAHKESLRKSKLVKASKAIAREKAADGEILPGKSVFYLDYDKKNKKYVFNKRVDLARKIIQMRLEGKGPRKIARLLNEENIPGPTGKEWYQMSVKRLLKSPVLYGAYQTHQIIEEKYIPVSLIENYYPALIDYQTFSQIQFDDKRVSKGRPSRHKFSGVLYCECGAVLCRKVNTYETKQGPKEYQYFNCFGSFEGRCKNNKAIRDLHIPLEKAIDKLQIKTRSVKNIKNEQIIAKREKIDQLNKMLLELEMPPVSVLKTISTLEKELQELLEQPDVQPPKSADVKTLVAIKDAEQYNLYLKRLVKRITIFQLNGPKNIRIKIEKTDGHYQSFIVNNGKIMFNADTKALQEHLRKLKEGTSDED